MGPFGQRMGPFGQRMGPFGPKHVYWTQNTHKGFVLYSTNLEIAVEYNVWYFRHL